MKLGPHPNRFKPNSRKQALFSVVLGGVVLCSAAFYNGYAIVFPDTSGYIGMAVNGSKTWARTISYSYLIFPFHLLKTLWPVVFMQGLMTAHLIYLLLSRILQGVSIVIYLSTVILLTLLTALPWVACYIMADLFTGIVILTMFLLGFLREKLSFIEKIYVLFLCALAVSTHYSHILVSIFILITIFLMKLLYGKGLKASVLGVLPVTGAIFLAIGATVLSNIAYHGPKRAGGYGQIFTLARFLEDGPAYLYLRDNCPGRGYILCGFIDELDGPKGHFLWGKGAVLSRAGGPEAIADEASEIVLGSLGARPFTHIKNSAAATLSQLVAFRTGSGMGPFPAGRGKSGWLLPRLAGFFPGERDAIYRAKQHSQSIPFRQLNRVHRPAVFASVLLAVLLLIVLGRKRAALEICFAGTVFSGLLGNAFVAASLSGVFGRYQSRVIWLVVFVAIVIGLKAWNEGLEFYRERSKKN